MVSIGFRILIITVTSLFLLGATSGASPAVRNIHVAVEGADDGGDGSREEPFASLQRARNKVRTLKKKGKLGDGITVVVHEGSYFLQEPLKLSKQDSGTEDAPVVYRPYQDAEVHLIGGVKITGFEQHDGDILKADVTNSGIHEVPAQEAGLYEGDIPGTEIFYGGRRQSLARWPTKICRDPRMGEWALIPKAPKNQKKWFNYSGERPEKWSRPEEAQVNIWCHYNYRNQCVGVKSVDAKNKRIMLADATSYSIYPGRRYFVRNVFEELDAAGEWYLDRNSGTLYFWPPGPVSAEDVIASKLKHIVHLDGTSYVTVRGFTIEACIGTAVVVDGGRHNTIGGCVIRNTQADAVHIDGGKHNAAVGNDIYDVGRNGIMVRGGDRDSLTPANNHATNNNIHHTGRLVHTYTPGLHVRGVGNALRHNIVHHCPHMAMGLSGNDHIIEFNEIHHAMMISSHGGAFYTGRDFTYRGNVIRYNKFHDIYGYGIERVREDDDNFTYASPVRTLPGAFAVHLDDQVSGFQIYGNVFYRLALGAIRLGGGRNTNVENNIFYDAGWGMHIDNRGRTWQTLEKRGGTLLRRLRAIDYKQPPWSEKYPALVDVLEDRPGEPLDNSVHRNIFVSSSLIYNFRSISHDRTTVDNNVLWAYGKPVSVKGHIYNHPGGGVLPFDEWQDLGFDKHSVVANPRFVDPESDRFQLQQDSPALKLGFEQIPTDRIGLYNDEFRASWPPPCQSDSRISPTREQSIEKFPIPQMAEEEEKAEAQRPQISVPRVEEAINVDGAIEPDEWQAAGLSRPLTIADNIKGTPLRARNFAWVAHDGRHLFVAFSNTLAAGQSLSGGERWGHNDAVEVAVSGDKSAGRDAPIFIFRGFPSGHFESSNESGIGGKLVSRARDAAEYAASVENRRWWTAEFSIALDTLGLSVEEVNKLGFNLTVYRAADRQWIMYNGTGGHSWRVDKAATIKLGT